MRPTRALIIVNGICVVGGVALGFVVLPDDWPPWRTALAGVFGGAWIGILFTATRLLGAYRDDESA